MQPTELSSLLATGKRPPLVLVLGPETALTDQALAALTAVVPEDQRSMNLAHYDMRQTPVGVALDDATSMPFFGDYRLVVMHDPYFLTGEVVKGGPTHDLAGLQAYFEQPTPSTMMVVVATVPKLDERKRLTKALKKAAVVVEAQPLSEQAAQKAVQAALVAAGVQIDRAGMALLTSRSNASYTTMMAQVQKLQLYAANGDPVTESVVAALVPKQLSDRVFDLVEAVVQRNVTLALSLYRDLLIQKEEPIRLNSLMVGQFRLLWQVAVLKRQGYAQGSIASTLKVHPYRVKLAMQVVAKSDPNAIKQAFDQLITTEWRMKTGQVDKTLAFELFVLRYATRA